MKKIKIYKEEGERFYPVTITDAIGHDQMKSSLTKLVNKYNLTSCKPTEGINKGPFYNIGLAIEVLSNSLDDNQKIPGVHAEFTATTGEVEVWEYFGGEFKFNDISGWRRIDSGVILELLEEVFPLSVELSSEPSSSVIRTRTPNKYTFSWNVYRKGKDVTEEATNTFNGSLTNKLQETVTINEPTHSTISFIFSSSYQGLTASTSKSITAVDDCYYGPVNKLWEPNVEDIKGFSKTYLKNSKSYVWSSINISNMRLCYAYPSYHGSLTSIKDGNNFEYIGSYTKISLIIDGVNYFVYTSDSTTTVSNYKQIFS